MRKCNHHFKKNNHEKCVISIALLVLTISCFVTYGQDKEKFNVFNQVKKSVVQIKSFEMPNIAGSPRFRQGTGFVIDENGLIVTNYHMIEEARGIIVYNRQNGKTDKSINLFGTSFYTGIQTERFYTTDKGYLFIGNIPGNKILYHFKLINK